jgi:hypothetical protein
VPEIAESAWLFKDKSDRELLASGLRVTALSALGSIVKELY